MFKHSQKGLGLSEIVVSMMLLSVGAVAVVDIQNKAQQTTVRSANIAMASNLSSDVIGRMMRNYDNLETYNTAFSSATETAKGSAYTCYSSFCSGTQQAYFDAYQVSLMANQNNMKLYMSTCPGVSNNRKCLAVYMDGATAANGSAAITDCVSVSSTGGYTYKRNDCLVVETI